MVAINIKNVEHIEKIAPPLKMDIAGTFFPSPTLRGTREQYRNERVSLLILRVVEDAEVRNLVDRLEAEGLEMVTDGRFRSDAWLLDFVCGLNGIRFRDDRETSIKLTDRIDMHHRPVLDGFVPLTGVTGGDVIAKQVLLVPSRLLAKLVKDASRTQLDLIYPGLGTLLVDTTQVYQKLIMELHRLGYRYLQLDDTTRTATDNAIRINGMALKNLPADPYITFHSPTKMLFSLRGVNAFFLGYDSECCDKNRLLWFIRGKQSIFGSVLSHYSVEEELEELRAKIDQIICCIPLHRFSLYIPNAGVLPSEPYEEAEEKR